MYIFGGGEAVQQDAQSNLRYSSVFLILFLCYEECGSVCVCVCVCVLCASNI